MTPEVTDYIAKARECLEEARQIAAIGLLKVAARSTYYAAFHAAEALILARTGKIAKTHSGVRSELSRLTRGNRKDDLRFGAFLAEAYLYKEISDYGIGEHGVIAKHDVDQAMETARRCIEAVVIMLQSDV